ncbi:hypothetical protein SRABI121_01410 [Microbacterium sp. Bi121]|nr:hypothetical protein SRABI121_01410 [Microbacterium sp. Bi121]
MPVCASSHVENAAHVLIPGVRPSTPVDEVGDVDADRDPVIVADQRAAERALRTADSTDQTVGSRHQSTAIDIGIHLSHRIIEPH